MPNFYIGSDYAGLDTRNFSCYYGYECTDDNDNWCFVAKVKGQEDEIIPYGSIEGARDMFNCEECLLAGMTMFLSNYRLELD